MQRQQDRNTEIPRLDHGETVLRVHREWTEVYHRAANDCRHRPKPALPAYLPLRQWPDTLRERVAWREHGSNLFDFGDGLSKLDELTINQIYQVDIEVVEGVAAAVGGKNNPLPIRGESGITIEVGSESLD